MEAYCNEGSCCEQRGHAGRPETGVFQARSASLWARHFPCITDLTCRALKKQPWWALRFPRQLCRHRHTLRLSPLVCREPGPREGIPWSHLHVPGGEPPLQTQQAHHRRGRGEERRGGHRLPLGAGFRRVCTALCS